MRYYNDLEYCKYYKKCKNSKNCGRHLTEDVIADAKKKRIKICEFITEPNCFTEKNKK